MSECCYSSRCRCSRLNQLSTDIERNRTGKSKISQFPTHKNFHKSFSSRSARPFGVIPRGKIPKTFTLIQSIASVDISRAQETFSLRLFFFLPFFFVSLLGCENNQQASENQRWENFLFCSDGRQQF
jgi:hypothetical protein